MKTRKICPSCKSTNIALWMGAELGVRYRCGDCGYIGPIVLEEKNKKSSSAKR
ncbi:MAG: hypothetical protein HZB67_03215 [Candidatus Aenigmarchaeota archaeon]|nr:hypothetical protein [Candidatus Aenigmarchaeota archaeon]